MADWKDNYQKGSFRGVSFFTQSHEFSAGRRTVDHEFPSKEQGNSEDIGKRLNRFTLEAYVLGDNYFESRNALRDALLTPGPGELVHPYLGNQTVQVAGFNIRESTSEGRIARFSIEFVEAGIPKFPVAENDAVNAVENLAEVSSSKAGEVLASTLSVVGFPARVADEAAQSVSDVADQVESVAKLVGTAADTVAEIAFAIRDIKADALDLVKTPSLLATRFQDAFNLLIDATTNYKQLSNALSSSTSTLDLGTYAGQETATVNRIRGNRTGIQNFAIELSLSTQARAAIQGSYTSVNEAVDVRELLNDNIDAHLFNITDDDLFQNIKDLQVQINKGLPPESVGEIVEFTPPITLPALVISYELFKSVSKEQEIIDNNDIRHPGFVPGNVEIEVSSG